MLIQRANRKGINTYGIPSMCRALYLLFVITFNQKNVMKLYMTIFVSLISKTRLSEMKMK